MKKIISFILALNLAILIWAMPSFSSYLPDFSGDYVYYKDNTFLRESYVGILYYDNSTLQLRYYAPIDEEQKLPEIEVSTLISLNPDSDHIELTGERILTTVLPGSDNVQIVNYLHDIVYEFGARRKLVKNLNERDIVISQEYEQFGGRVNITYDCTIPLFNIRDIKKSNGEVLLHCITTGRLQDNSDTTFDNFKGFPEQEKIKKGKKYKKSKEVKCFFGEQSVVLDESWKQPIENYWTRDDDSILSMATMPQAFDNKEKNELFFIRTFIKSSPNSYVNFDTLKIEKDGNRLIISSEVYQPLKDNYINNIKILTDKYNSTSFDYFTIATFMKPYITNKKYYDNILDSYKN